MDMLEQGIAAAQAGDWVQAQALLLSHVERNPDSETGWLWLAAIVDTPEEALACLEHALLVNPNSRRARAGLEWARARQAPSAPTEPALPSPSPEPISELAPPPPVPEPTSDLAPEASPAGLLRRLGPAAPAPAPLVARPRHVSPYAPTQLFSESQLATLPTNVKMPPDLREPEPEGSAFPEAVGTETAEAPEEFPEEEGEPLGPPPSLAERLGAFWAGPAGPQPTAAPAGLSARPLAEPAEAESRAGEEELLGPPPSLAERLGTLETPAASTWDWPEELPEEEEAEEEPLGPPPSLADRLGAWGTPIKARPAAPGPTPARPALEPEPESAEPLGPPPSLADRLGGWGAPTAAPAPARPEGFPTAPARPGSSLSERLMQLRGTPPPPAPAGKPTETAEELFARGEAALEANQVQEAEKAFREALQVDPNHAPAHANLAMVHYINKRYDEAIAELKIAVQYRPDYEDAWYTLGVIMNEVGRTDDAINAWRQLLQINPAHSEAQRELNAVSQTASVSAAREEPTGKAIQCPSCGGTILTAVSTCPHCGYELFIVCPRCKEYIPSNSRRCPKCELALKVSDVGGAGEEESPRHMAEVHSKLGMAHLENGRGAEAQREWREAIAADPTYAVPHFYMGLLFIEQRQVSRAIEAFQQAVRLDPEYAAAYLELGLLYLAQKRRIEARRYFEECLKHNPRAEVQREAQTRLASLR